MSGSQIIQYFFLSKSRIEIIPFFFIWSRSGSRIILYYCCLLRSPPCIFFCRDPEQEIIPYFFFLLKSRTEIIPYFFPGRHPELKKSYVFSHKVLNPRKERVKRSESWCDATLPTEGASLLSQQKFLGTIKIKDRL